MSINGMDRLEKWPARGQSRRAAGLLLPASFLVSS